MAIIMRISDGLGNQLFQYACGYAVAKKTKQKLILDPAFKGNFRKYQLKEFNIEYRENLLNKCLCMFLKIDRSGILIRKYREMKIKKYTLIKEKKEFAYDEEIFKYDEPIFLKGYWQSCKYFDNYMEEIKRQFKYKRKLSSRALEYINEVKATTSIALHIRRTDYLRTTNSVCLSLDYYEKALIKIQEKVKNFTIYIFSDDKQFVKDKFPLYCSKVVTGLRDLEEFVVMQACTHHIIANSTFSWWAAYLTENIEGITIAPVVGIWTEDFYPSKWITLETMFERIESGENEYGL